MEYIQNACFLSSIKDHKRTHEKSAWSISASAATRALLTIPTSSTSTSALRGDEDMKCGECAVPREDLERSKYGQPEEASIGEGDIVPEACFMVGRRR